MTLTEEPYAEPKLNCIGNSTAGSRLDVSKKDALTTAGLEEDADRLIAEDREEEEHLREGEL